MNVYRSEESAATVLRASEQTRQVSGSIPSFEPTIYIIAKRLSVRLLILQYVFSVGGVWCHALGMQFVMLRNAPKSCVHLRKFIFLSGVAVLAVSLSRRQMAKVVVMGARKKELEPGAKMEEKTERKCSHNTVESDEYKHVVVLINDHILTFCAVQKHARIFKLIQRNAYALPSFSHFSHLQHFICFTSMTDQRKSSCHTY